MVSPFSTGITYALIERATADQIPLFTMGYGRTDASDGRVFPYVFTMPTTYWSQATSIIEYINEQEGGDLAGKKIALVYHDSAYGREPIPTLEILAEQMGFQLDLFPVAHPGLEQKATWLQIGRRLRPDWVVMWGWGVMNATAIREAAAVGFPMDHFIGNHWAGAEVDVTPAGDDAEGYLAANFHSPGADFQAHQDILTYVYDKNLGAGERERVGEVLYNRGLTNAAIVVEAIRKGQEIHGERSDIVLPSSTWYEKNDLNTSDMHPFIHPLSRAVDPAWESRSDWDIYKGLAKTFSELCPGHLGTETDIVQLPILHDTPGELGQALDVKDWKRGECEPVPGKTMPNFIEVVRDYPDTYRKFTSLGPLLSKLGNGGKGIGWNTEDEVALLGRLNRVVNEEGVSKGQPRIETDIDAAEVVLSLAPETNGQVAVKAWQALSKITGREHAHLALPKQDEKIRFRDLQAQPRKIISSPTWSGLEDEHVSYNAGYTNVHELIPWRTLTGRQQFYQDHTWMRDFGESLCVYKPPINTKTVTPVIDAIGGDSKQVVLNWITPHQKWGIHSTYSENLLLLTLSRGGPCVWMSEVDAAKIDCADNDWIELYNTNGVIAARAVVSQRVPEGMVMMYHAQEKIINTPLSQITGQRGGIHNSVTRAVVKPTHMIGGYAQLAWGFNYYGTVGSNRDEFVVVRKLPKVEWHAQGRKAGEEAMA